MSVERAICPDIYHPAVARDGLLTRLRIPGGVLNLEQCIEIEQLLAATGLEYIQVTNRANLQLRGLGQDLEPGLLAKLTECGLAATSTAVDGIRNIMTSPTAGIDATEFIDVRPLVADWDEYLTAHPELEALSNKFSVGFDGGGSVSILDRPNDITLLAVSRGEFLLHLAMGLRGDAPVPLLLGLAQGGLRLTLNECIPMLGAIAQAYRRESAGFGDVRRKPRLREIIEVCGLQGFLKVVKEELLRSGVYLTQRFALVGFPDVKSGCASDGFPVHESAPSSESRQRGTEDTLRYTEEGVYGHLGVWGQRQMGLSYVGVVLPLGRWSLEQVRGLGSIASQYGSGAIRLTPWQNAIVPDIPDDDVARVQGLIEELGLEVGANHVRGLLTACAGASGCQFGATDTQGDALVLSEYLESQLKLDQPLNIHFSGCDKSCAQHYQADIALWGREQTGGYRLCVSGGAERLGRELRDDLTPGAVRIAIECLIRFYHKQRDSPQESFRAFTNRQSLAQLQQVLHAI